MKKLNLIFGILFIMVGLFINSCHDDIENVNSNNWKKENNIYSINPKFSPSNIKKITPIFTYGGHVEQEVNQLNDYAIKCVKDKSRLSKIKDKIIYVGIYTLTNFNSKGSNNEDAISLYSDNGGYLEHTFFIKQKDNSYKEIKELNFKTQEILKKDISFMTFYSKLFLQGSTSFYILENSQNTKRYNKTKSEKLASNKLEIESLTNDFQVFESATLASYITLDSQPDEEILGAIQAVYSDGVGCWDCGVYQNGGSCKYSYGQSSCHMSIGCGASSLEESIESSYDSYFDTNLMYGFRDNVLMNSTIGLKYYYFYYYSSLPEETIGLSVSEKIQVATSLPTFYSVINRLYENNNTDNDIYLPSEKQTVINLLNLYYENTNNDNFRSILQNIESDINTMDGMSFNELNQIIY